MKRAVMGAISLLVCGASLPQERPRGIVPEPAISLCAVLADAPKYEDKEIVVRGLYRMVIHGAVLIDNACSHTDVNLRESSGYKVNKAALSLLRSLTKKDRFRAVDVVFRGIFHVAHEGQCFGQICAAYEIETMELVTARP
jgi:hypothetical protein